MDKINKLFLETLKKAEKEEKKNMCLLLFGV